MSWTIVQNQIKELEKRCSDLESGVSGHDTNYELLDAKVGNVTVNEDGTVPDSLQSQINTVDDKADENTDDIFELNKTVGLDAEDYETSILNRIGPAYYKDGVVVSLQDQVDEINEEVGDHSADISLNSQKIGNVQLDTVTGLPIISLQDQITSFAAVGHANNLKIGDVELDSVTGLPVKTLQEQITENYGYISSNGTAIYNLQVARGDLANRISSVEGYQGMLQLYEDDIKDISNIRTDVSDNASSISSNASRLTTLEGANLDSRITALETSSFHPTQFVYYGPLVNSANEGGNGYNKMAYLNIENSYVAGGTARGVLTAKYHTYYTNSIIKVTFYMPYTLTGHGQDNFEFSISRFSPGNFDLALMNKWNQKFTNHYGGGSRSSAGPVFSAWYENVAQSQYVKFYMNVFCSATTDAFHLDTDTVHCEIQETIR